jgi:hypothetical protein
MLCFLRSSTEAELIAVDDTLPTVQWTRSFMKDQGYDLETVIKEDNKSSILLMKNGRISSGRRTKHLDIRYFHIKDLLCRGIVKIEHCKTENMIADFFTKPLQGKISSFKRFDSKQEEFIYFTIQERVGKQYYWNFVKTDE